MTKSDGTGRGVANRIRIAREALQLQPKDVAEQIGVNLPSYYDLECHDDEVFDSVELQTLSRLLFLLRLDPQDLFLAPAAKRKKLSKLHWHALGNMIETRMKEKGLNRSELEASIDYVVPEKIDVEELRHWNLDQLVQIGSILGIEWAALFYDPLC